LFAQYDINDRLHNNRKLIEDYLDHIEKVRRLQKSSVEHAGMHLRKLEGFCRANMVDILLVTPNQIRRWLGYIRKNRVAAATIAKIISAWRSFYRWQQHFFDLKANPLGDIKSPKAQHGLPRVLSVREVQQIIEIASQQAADAFEAFVHRPKSTATSLSKGASQVQLHCAIEMLYGAGLRVAELLSLDALPHTSSIGWIDCQADEVHVNGKGERRRSVPLGSYAKHALLRWLEIRELKIKDCESVDKQALFLGIKGRRLGAPAINAQLKALAKSAGLHINVHPHMLRHSFATHILESGGNLLGVQGLLGHVSIRSTQIYTHLDTTHLKKIYYDHHPRAKLFENPAVHSRTLQI